MTKCEHITRFFKCLDTDEKHYTLQQKYEQLRRLDVRLVDLREEFCYYVASSKPLNREARRQVLWLIEPNTDDDYVTVSDTESNLRANQAALVTSNSLIIEVGPRLNYCSPFSTNAVSILKSSCPQAEIYRIERSTIYDLSFSKKLELIGDVAIQKLIRSLHDEMVETVYQEPVISFNPDAQRAKIASGEDWLQPSAAVDILGRGEAALREVSQKLGLFFDDWDINYYVNLFRDSIKRNPTVVECFDLAQSNSEHSRHWFFKGILDVEGRKTCSKSLIDMVASTQKTSNQNNVIKFDDNSSAMQGFDKLRLLLPKQVGCYSSVNVAKNQHRHIIFTAETHNFPTGVAPFPGAATGTGGRIRDVQATGRGAHVIAGTAGYSFGNLLIDDYELDWENPHELYPNNLAHPSKIAIEASNGASDYGNKFGEPIVAGFARSFGMRLVSPKSKSTERWEYLKPIMFTGGVGTIDAAYTKKLKPEEGMLVAKIGGPVYRIGIGGGAASSAATDDKSSCSTQTNKLNFNAVQRGDPEMEQKLNRVIRACIENRSVYVDDQGSEYNPIFSIHDQGAGGNGNVLKEIVDPLGTTIDANSFTLGDPTVNILELWAAEYQESDAILACNSKKSKQLLDQISRREKCKIDVVGQVEDSGQIRLRNFEDHKQQSSKEKEYPIDLKLEYVIGSMPRKVFNLLDYCQDEFLSPAKLIETDEPPKSLKSRYKLLKNQIYIMNHQDQMRNNFDHLLKKVLKLPSVASKRYLTTKVDRCVTGLIAGQQCLGPLHTPISDYALVALTHFDYRGTVTSIGEQPIKGLVSPVSNATMSVAEALTNMMFCVITSLEDVKCSANWMWAAKLPGEGAKLLDACDAMCKLMSRLGIAVDGGKDSLSMSATVDPVNATKVAQNIDPTEGDADQEDDVVEVVKSPGTLVISAYAPVPDIRCKVTPILQAKPKLNHLIYVNLTHPVDTKRSSDITTHADLTSITALIAHKTPTTASTTATTTSTSTTSCITSTTATTTTTTTSTSLGIVSTTTTNTNSDQGKTNKFRLGGSAILQTLGQIGDEAPNIDHPELLRDGFKIVQELIKSGICTAGHDVSDGGLIVCVLEMAIASNCGVHLSIQAEKSFTDLGCANNEEKILGALFSEECAVIIEVKAETEKDLNDVLKRFHEKNIQAQRIGFGSYENRRVTVKFEQQLLLEYDNINKLREYWESTSRQLDLRQANNKCVNEEYESMSSRVEQPDWKLTFDPNETSIVVDFDKHYLNSQPKVAVLREEGINGDREMIASLTLAGFEVFDVTVTDLLATTATKLDLNMFDGLVFPGGFSYADVFGSGRGWAASLLFNNQIKQQLIQFRRRPNTFSLGVCNGCQLMSLLGFLDDLPKTNDNQLIDIPRTSVRLEHNVSGRFECRFVNVKIEATTNSIMLRDMEESSFGVWVAHGEGRFKIEQSIEIDSETRIALRYVDDKNDTTMEYPMNPNGSDQAVAGLCSHDGRHLAMMPHPERCTQMWQWPYIPSNWRTDKDEIIKISPWMRMFTNAYEFCKHDSANQE